MAATKNDSITRVQQEYMAYGKPLSDEARTAMQKKFGDIKFDSVSKWYPVPMNLVLSHRNKSITFEFNAIEPGGFFW